MLKSNQQYWRSIIAALAFVLGLLGSTPSAQAQSNPNPGVIPVNGEYRKLAAQWWQWAESFPVSQNPLFDETGALACLGEQEEGNLFFLGGVFNASGTATRNITLPAGTRLFFPTVNVLWDNVGVDPPLNPQGLFAQADLFVAAINALHASLDGQPVQNPFGYRAKSNGPFCYKLPATDNIYQFFGAGALLPPFACHNGFCICPAVADGYWLLLRPLPVGQHTLNFGGTIGPPVNFSLNITYNITVVPRDHYRSCRREDDDDR
ncbi:MAG: hypothetical protein HYR56_06490 [Acidobacteria bacterium]|nr:hypothetical protein [Acidobacteriota bacterium]MBI3423925.1 hypothetical protein [Acidobacteriota bacterium]